MAITFYYNNSKIQIFKIISDMLENVIQMHSHAKNGYEIHLIYNGKGILETPEGQYKLSKNSLYITGPNVFHKQIPDKQSPMHELCIYLKISSGSKDNTINYFTSQPFWIGKSNSEIRTIFKQMIEEHEKNGPWSESILSALCIKLIAEISRLYSPENASSNSTQNDNDLNESRSWILDQLVLDLDDDANATLDNFAKRMGVCPRQAERIIKEHYGSSFKNLKYESRMAMAATLLEQNSISIEECAARCGYASASSFISAFKNKYNVTPKKYRERK
ncbi:MAG: AraC family transcriptional regulator [Eubacterium sp.]|nr:AraC family transcriptional regulator [Eubacterium sp.]